MFGYNNIIVKMQLFVCLCVIVGVNALSVPFMDFGYVNDRQCGVEASPNLIHQNPWMVYLEYYHNDVRNNIRCGGTLIGSRYIVTAAHCVNNKDMFTRYSLVARLGEYDLYSDEDSVNGVRADPVVRINVVQIFVPKTYDGKEDDIAVLKLAKDAPYTDFIRPICLPTPKEEAGNDVTFTAAGWGEISATHVYSHVKKIIPLPAWSKESCHKAYKKLKLPKKIICAGGEEGIDTCRGDSGGPLTLNNERVELWGVTSSGNVHCGSKGYPGIYTSVVSHLEFIIHIVSSAKANPWLNKQSIVTNLGRNLEKHERAS